MVDIEAVSEFGVLRLQLLEHLQDGVLLTCGNFHTMAARSILRRGLRAVGLGSVPFHACVVVWIRPGLGFRHPAQRRCATS